jgi:hypothetical protein
MYSRTVLIGAMVICGALIAAPAFAQAHAGVRAGISDDPDQFFFGGHIETRELMKNVTFRPNAEIGIGDHATLVALNFEFVYSVPIQGKPARLYFGGGPALNIWSIDDDFLPSGFRGRDTGGGFNILAGVQHNSGLFGELKVGFVDSAELKVMIGYAFK